MKELDFTTLERIDKSFVTDTFSEKEFDLIYKINFKRKSLSLPAQEQGPVVEGRRD